MAKRTSHPINLQFRNIIFSVLLLLIAPFCSAAEKTALELEQLELIDQQHQQFSAKFYREFSKHSAATPQVYQTVNALENSVENLLAQHKPVVATNTILNNLSMLKTNYDDVSVFNVIKVLLDNNEWQSANSLLIYIKEDGDLTLAANVAYILAQFYFERQSLEKALEYLDDTINELPNENYHHALLIKGIALQKLTRHRKAIVAYEKIPQTSKYYVSARLNMAIANIRQGWWTDGYNIVQAILKNPGVQKQDTTIDRLYLTLGYSFLKQEYYRNSRESFRNVGLNGPFTNRALLGIALTAANQKDYVGALNAVRILKQKNTFELVVDESHLLMPYFYEQLQQHTTASTGYTEAINYYQGRISEIQNILASDSLLSSLYKEVPLSNSRKDSFVINIGKNQIDFSSHYPGYFFKNYLMLQSFRPYLDDLNNKQLLADFNQLKAKYDTTINKMTTIILTQRIEHLSSYMDQSRFGLARLYDKNLVSQQ
ncbi:tetratricopeptide repeat protein [Aliikangiella coralliicola]|uniref:Tetratricopeptide repeat protein n=1 Tax=Aliikangiella coralliicola TaxID=2592383 RepID=A0A545U8R1_9GAMM|nr:tetratricopeptide repeat protein [Aliikangiella coralliicola]TQV85860.1 tetratricopeptide repeat protein [Aliikangiella coralliicola]